MLVDSHCHLEVDTYGDELAAILQRARAAGVGAFVAVGASRVTGGADEAVALTEAHSDVFAAVGVHPHEAQGASDDTAALPRIDALLTHPKVVALGEIGLDYYYELSPPGLQRDIFARFLQMAKRHDKPVMLHIRDAFDDSYACLDEAGLPQAGGVVHCFSAGIEQARQYLQRGMYLSIPGIVTFKKAEALRDAVRFAPLDRLLVETDCPYLAPVPYRGKRNEPAYVVKTAEAVAALKGLSPAELFEQTTQNARRLFGLPAKPCSSSD